MPRFHIEIDVECDTLQEAEEWANRRLVQSPGFRHVIVSEEGPLVTDNPKGQRPNLEDRYLQVFIVHDQMIAAFQEWVTAHGWVLQEQPRFDMPATHYVVTHHIVPNAAAMRAAGFNVPEGQP